MPPVIGDERRAIFAGANELHRMAGLTYLLEILWNVRWSGGD